MVRTPCYDKSGRKKGTWTKEEDEKLKAYVTKYGCWNWRLIPKFAGLSRCGKSCRLRWMNYLRSDIKRGNFQKDEDDTILELHKTLGNRWSAIAAHLPGRTDNEIKNHWHTNLKKLSNQKPSNSQVEAATARSSADLCLQQSTPEEGSSSAKTLCVLNSKTTSPPLVSEAESSSITTDVAAEKTTSFGEAHRDVGFTEHSMELGGNLWTDPFISEEDSFSNPTDVSMGLYEDYDKFLPLYDEFLWP